ncbi:MAG TPA: DUF29 domain-containing protein [Cyanothece sp. UBA12306]|nr:DUF29 domain-containing protein [Cyanothece sp. UBA12306]
MTSEVITTTSKLYEKDYHLWLQQTIYHLKQSSFAEVDLPNLIEELEDMGRNEKRAIYSNLKVVLMHLLKYRHQVSKRSNSWRSSIREHRQRIKRAFKESPSLQGYFNEVLTECYQDAKELAAEETGLDLATFENKCPFTTEEILNTEYLPD